MGTTTVLSPTSRVRFGLAQVAITPPVGIYHPMWGAARHDRSTGIHRSLSAEVMAFGPADDPEAPPLIRVQLDWVGVGGRQQFEDLVRGVSEAGGVSPNRVLVGSSHTHAGGLFAPNRYEKPGGELIVPYLAAVGEKLQAATRAAVARMEEVCITYAAGRCNMAANRDYWDADYDGFTCGFNPDTPADDTVLVVRITDLQGNMVGTVVNYACHPTTLAWENTLISPDYVGAMREEVVRATGAPCIFLLGACGDLGPRDGLVGDTGVADRNGRQLGFAALSALMSMGPPGTDFKYQGPVVSGATLGTWAHVPLEDDRLAAVSRFSGGPHTVALPYKPLPDRKALQEDLDGWLAKQREADDRGDERAARDCGARAERVRRWQGRLAGLPEGETYPMPFSVFRLGDAVWVTCAGEPYSLIQMDLRRRFPAVAMVFSPLVGVSNAAYLLPEDRYGKGLYQEEPAVLGPGCLERLIEAVSEQIAAETD